MRRYAAIALIGSIAFCQEARDTHAQCLGICGDLNGSGAVNTADAVGYRTNYYLNFDWGPLDSSCAEVDHYEGNTVGDFSRLMAAAFRFGPDLVCTPDSGVLIPIPNADHYLHYNCLIPPGDTSIVVHVGITVTVNPMAVGIGYRFEVDGQPTIFGPITAADPPFWWFFNLWDPLTIPVPQGHLFARFLHHDPTHGAPRGSYDVCAIEVIVPVSAEYQVLTLEPAAWPPGDNSPMVVDRYTHEVLELNLDPITVALTGDANNDRMITSADVIELVNFVFKGGATPYPVPATGDVNCSGEVNSSDLISLVIYVFKGGAVPCDVESECTINLDQWTCP